MTHNHYASWEWQPLYNMPDGCVDVRILMKCGNVVAMCSNEFRLVSKSWVDRAIQFRYA